MSSPSSFYSLRDGSASRRESTHTPHTINERYACGDRYQGTVYTNPKGTKVKHGQGRYEFSNGSYYDGFWEEGAMHGKGSFWEATTGDRFDGLWDHGKRVYGVYYFNDGDLYIGGFDDATGHLKHGRCVVVEAMVPYDAEYENDAVVKRTVFDTRPVNHGPTTQRPRSVQASQRAAPAARSLEDEQLQAAKLILRSKREELSTDAVFPVESQTKSFGILQRGKSDRFHHARSLDAKDAVRYHHR